MRSTRVVFWSTGCQETGENMLQMWSYVVKMWGQIKNINFGCHGIPERCLTIKGKKMKICARCFGTNIGHILAFLLFIVGHLPSWYYSVGCVVIMFIDWSLQTFLKLCPITQDDLLPE